MRLSMTAMSNATGLLLQVQEDDADPDAAERICEPGAPCSRAAHQLTSHIECRGSGPPASVKKWAHALNIKEPLIVAMVYDYCALEAAIDIRCAIASLAPWRHLHSLSQP